MYSLNGIVQRLLRGQSIASARVANAGFENIGDVLVADVVQVRHPGKGIASSPLEGIGDGRHAVGVLSQLKPGEKNVIGMESKVAVDG